MKISKAGSDLDGLAVEPVREHLDGRTEVRLLEGRGQYMRGDYVWLRPEEMR